MTKLEDFEDEEPSLTRFYIKRSERLQSFQANARFQKGYRAHYHYGGLREPPVGILGKAKISALTLDVGLPIFSSVVSVPVTDRILEFVLAVKKSHKWRLSHGRPCTS